MVFNVNVSEYPFKENIRYEGNSVFPTFGKWSRYSYVRVLCPPWLEFPSRLTIKPVSPPAFGRVRLVIWAELLFLCHKCQNLLLKTESKVWTVRSPGISSFVAFLSRSRGLVWKFPEGRDSLMSRQFCPSPWVVWKNVVETKYRFFRPSDGLPTTHFMRCFYLLSKNVFGSYLDRDLVILLVQIVEKHFDALFSEFGASKQRKNGPLQGPNVGLVLTLAQKKRNHNQNTSRPLCLVARETIQLA